MPFDLDRDTVAYLVLAVVGWRQRQSQTVGLVQNGHGDRVMKLALGGGRKSNDLISRPVTRRKNAADFRLIAGQSADLVE